MRVLAMVHAYPPVHNAGAEMTIHAMLAALVQAGHEAHVVLNRADRKIPADYTYDGVQVHAHRSSTDPFPYFRGHDYRADVVLTHLENTPRASALGEVYRIPVVHVLHNTHTWTKQALRRGPCELAVYNTTWMREDYQAWWLRNVGASRPMPHATTVYPVVDPEPFADVDPPLPGAGAITLINLNEDKGGRHFWRIAKQMPERQFLGVKGAYGDQVDSFWPDRGNVEILDHVAPREMPAKVWSRTGVLLVPSNYESYGRVAIEAAHCGIPVLAHPTPGLREALGASGIFIDRDDPKAWVMQLRRLAEPEHYRATSAAIRAHAQTLTPAKDLARFVDEIERTVRRGPTR